VARLAAALCLSQAAGAGAGCDPSKDALLETRSQLANMTAERDQLKGQVDTMRVSMETMKIDNDANRAKLAEAEAKLAACASPAPKPKAKKGTQP
jgi:hypothetical protein